MDAKEFSSMMQFVDGLPSTVENLKLDLSDNELTLQHIEGLCRNLEAQEYRKLYMNFNRCGLASSAAEKLLTWLDGGLLVEQELNIDFTE